MKLYLVRHGVADDAQGRCVGHHDLALSEQGTAQMEALAATWDGPPPDRCLASDLARTAASARILVARWSLPVHTDARLREMHFGAWEGRTWDAIQHDDGERLARWMQHWTETAPPGGEAFVDVVARVRRRLDELRGEADDRARIVAVLHAGSIRAALCQALALPLERAFRFRVDPASVSVLVLGAAGWEAAWLNGARFQR